MHLDHDNAEKNLEKKFVTFSRVTILSHFAAFVCFVMSDQVAAADK